MDNNNNNNHSFKKVENEKKSYSIQKAKVGFFRGFLFPFLAGTIGSVIIFGAAVNIPAVKDYVVTKLSTDTEKIESKSDSNEDSNSIAKIVSGSSETQFSVKDYSDISTTVANKVLPSVVGIKVTYSINSPYYAYYGMTGATATATGSGVIISDDGYILTNNHVVATSSTSSYYQVSEATSISVTLYNDDTEYEAKIIGTDEQTDLAVLKIEKTGLKAAELGDSDKVQVGEFAMAIGNPLNMPSTVTTGIISAKDRTITSENATYKVIQTDAAINSGNSGGALINSEGKVIGINTLKLAGSGIEGLGFAIPINDTVNVYKELITNGKVSRPSIGISGRTIDEATAKQYNFPKAGVYVASVTPFSPAEKGGLQAGDLIVELNGKSVASMDELNSYKNEHKIGDEITLKIIRDKEEKEIKITLGESN